MIKLTNVIAAKDIEENLISRRRFADTGSSIYLGNQKHKVIGKESGEILLKEIYEKLNWMVISVARKMTNDVQNLEYENYNCRVRLVNQLDDETPQQSQTHGKVSRMLTSEGVEIDSNLEENYSDLEENVFAIGREHRSCLAHEEENIDAGSSKS